METFFMHMSKTFVFLFCSLLFAPLPSLNSTPHTLPERFNPQQIAAIETRMWRAYYKQDYPALLHEGLLALQTQFGLPREKAAEIAADFAKAAYLFSTTQGSYDQNVLPGLSRAYEDIRLTTQADFSSESVAKAEIAWWKARRTAGENSPENVGRLIANLYFELYGRRNHLTEEAGLLRAQAAHMRDQSNILGKEPEWKKIEETLTKSYTALQEGLKNKAL